jgi:hypothetical protein
VTIYVSRVCRTVNEHLIGLPLASCSVAPVKRTLYCYAQEHLASRLRDVVEVHEAADRVATEHGYLLGPLFIEECNSSQAMQELIEAATAHDGATAVAVPSRGHFVPLGRPREWQLLLEQLTGHPLVFTGRTH